MTDSIKRKAHKEALNEFREKHLHELEETIQVFIEIRDNPEAQDRNRIEAGKSVARMLAALQPDRQVQPKETKKKDEEVFTKDEEKDILDRVDKILNATNTTQIPS